METISLKVTPEEKLLLQTMAKFEGVSMSELIRSRTLESLEDEYDAKIGELALNEYHNYLEAGGEELSWDDL